jgi:hypothetical protein
MSKRALRGAELLASVVSNVQPDVNPLESIEGVEAAVEQAVPSSSPEAPSEKKSSVSTRTQEPVMVLEVVRIEGKEGKVFYRALTNKGIFFVEGKVPEKFPCLGFLETRVTEDGKTYRTVYITSTSPREFRRYARFLGEFFGE